MTERQPAPIYVHVSEAQATFGLARSTIYAMAKRGDVTIYNVGRSSLLKVAEVTALIEANPQTQPLSGGLAGGLKRASTR